MQPQALRSTPTGVEPISPGPPRAVRRPVMLQGWHDLAALHWRYEPTAVQSLLPDGFTVDTFDGSAWVGLIPFHMRRIRLPGLPALGPLSTFPETNVRTYIVAPDGRRGVWFFSLDITRAVPAAVARLTYRLPYCWSAMAITGDGAGLGATRSYTTRRRRPRPDPVTPAVSRITVRIGRRLGPDEMTDLDHFLTARWALGTTFARRMMWAEVEHAAWPVHAADVLECDDSLIAAAGLAPPSGEPVARWSPGVDVRIGAPRPIGRRDPA